MSLLGSPRGLGRGEFLRVKMRQAGRASEHDGEGRVDRGVVHGGVVGQGERSKEAGPVRSTGVDVGFEVVCDPFVEDFRLSVDGRSNGGRVAMADTEETEEFSKEDVAEFSALIGCNGGHGAKNGNPMVEEGAGDRGRRFVGKRNHADELAERTRGSEDVPELVGRRSRERAKQVNMHADVGLGGRLERQQRRLAGGKTRRVLSLLTKSAMADKESDVSGQIGPPKPLGYAVDGFGNAQMTGEGMGMGGSGNRNPGRTGGDNDSFEIAIRLGKAEQSIMEMQAILER